MNLNEARKNPEQNPKEDVLESLYKFSLVSGTFVHFSNVNQLTINPKSTDENNRYTPIGIYGYPLDYYSKKIRGAMMFRSIDRKGDKEKPLAAYLNMVFPFASDRRYISVLVADSGFKWMHLNTPTIKEPVFGKMVAVVNSVYMNNVRTKSETALAVAKRNLDKTLSDVTKGFGRISGEAVLYSYISRVFTLEPALMNKVIQAIEYDGVLDSGGELLFKNVGGRSEPAQAVFLNKKFKVQKTFINHQFPEQ